MQKWFSFVVEALVAVITGVVTSYWLAPERGFTVGAITLVLLEVFRLRSHLDQLEAAVGRQTAFTQGLFGEDAFSELRLIYARRPGTCVSANSVSVDREQALRFWHDCLAHASRHWFVATYSVADESWHLGWGRSSSLEIQRERIASGCRITRVFVVESESEKDATIDTMRQQRSIGVDVRWILKSELTQNRMVQEALKELRTLDVAVVDGSWVYRTHLDRQRKITGASAMIGSALVKQADFLVNEAYKRGAPIV
jgi:hypothetical protein